MYRVPRQDRAKRSLQAIVDAGSPCLAQRGQAIATTHDAGQQAGIGSAYDCGDDKEAIFEAHSLHAEAAVRRLRNRFNARAYRTPSKRRPTRCRSTMHPSCARQTRTCWPTRRPRRCQTYGPCATPSCAAACSWWVLHRHWATIHLLRVDRLACLARMITSYLHQQR